MTLPGQSNTPCPCGLATAEGCRCGNAAAIAAAKGADVGLGGAAMLDLIADLYRIVHSGGPCWRVEQGIYCTSCTPPIEVARGVLFPDPAAPREGALSPG